MQCPYCGAELIYHDFYGKYLGCGQWNKKGDIYKCPNSEGFENEDEAINYTIKNNYVFSSVELIVCDSEMHNGNFHTDENGELHEGYPC